MSESKKEEKLEPFRSCRGLSWGSKSTTRSLIWAETVFGLLQSDRKKLNQRPPAAPGHKVTRRCEKWGLSLESVHKGQRSEWVTSPVGLVWFLVLFFCTYSHTSAQWELQVRLTRRSLSWWLHQGTAVHQCNIEKRWKYQRQSLDDQESQWLMQSEQKDAIVVLSNGRYWWSGQR